MELQWRRLLTGRLHSAYFADMVGVKGGRGPAGMGNRQLHSTVDVAVGAGVAWSAPTPHRLLSGDFCALR